LRGIREDLLTDSQTGYTWHVYAGHDNNSVMAWETMLDGLDEIRPVFVTEWGFQRFTSEHYRGTPLSFGFKLVYWILTRHRLSSTAWCWHSYWGLPMLHRDWRTPTEFGAFVCWYLRLSP
jgi:hypothetical protein